MLMMLASMPPSHTETHTPLMMMKWTHHSHDAESITSLVPTFAPPSAPRSPAPVPELRRLYRS